MFIVQQYRSRQQGVWCQRQNTMVSCTRSFRFLMDGCSNKILWTGMECERITPNHSRVSGNFCTKRTTVTCGLLCPEFLGHRSFRRDRIMWSVRETNEAHKCHHSRGILDNPTNGGPGTRQKNHFQTRSSSSSPLPCLFRT